MDSVRHTLEAVDREYQTLQRALVERFRVSLGGLSVTQFLDIVRERRPEWSRNISDPEHWPIQQFLGYEYETYLMSMRMIEYYGGVDETVEQIFALRLDLFDMPAFVWQMRTLIPERLNPAASRKWGQPRASSAAFLAVPAPFAPPPRKCQWLGARRELRRRSAGWCGDPQNFHGQSPSSILPSTRMPLTNRRQTKHQNCGTSPAPVIAVAPPLVAPNAAPVIAVVPPSGR